MADQIRDEIAFTAAPVGTVMRDRQGDVWVKKTERGAEQNGETGLWGPTWVAYPAVVLVPATQGVEVASAAGMFLGVATEAELASADLPSDESTSQTTAPTTRGVTP